jgi:hypothetical protein
VQNFVVVIEAMAANRCLLLFVPFTHNIIFIAEKSEMARSMKKQLARFLFTDI